MEQTSGPTEWQTPGHIIGVPPWNEKYPNTPLPTDPKYDLELLANGDTRNVVDHYRYWKNDAIIEHLNQRRHPFHVAIENFEHDHNIGTVVRTANAFLADSVHIVGKRRWNRRGAMVTDKYQNIIHQPSLEDLHLYANQNNLSIVAVDNKPGATPIETAELPRNCILLFGQEGPGITETATEISSQMVSITQYGSTRSINAGVAAGIIMHAWIRQHADFTMAW